MTLKEYGIDLEKEQEMKKKNRNHIRGREDGKGMKGIGIRSGNMSKHNTSHHPQHFFVFAPNIAYGCEYMQYNRNSCAVSYLLRYRATNVDLGMSRKNGTEERCRFV